MEGHQQQLHNIPNVLPQIEQYGEGGVYTSLPLPGQGMETVSDIQFMNHQGGNVNTSGIDTLLAQWTAELMSDHHQGVNIDTHGGTNNFIPQCSIVEEPMNLSKIQDQHQFMNHQGVNINTHGGNNKLIPQWSSTVHHEEPRNFPIIDHNKHDDQFMSHHQGVTINTSCGDKFYSQWSVVKPNGTLMFQDQHQFISHQAAGVTVNTDGGGGGDDRFPQWSVEETRYLLMIREELDQKFLETNQENILWQVIANKMKLCNGYNRSADQCYSKWKDLVNLYKDCITTGTEIQTENFPFYNQLHKIFMQRLLRPKEHTKRKLNENTNNVDSTSHVNLVGSLKERLDEFMKKQMRYRMQLIKDNEKREDERRKKEMQWREKMEEERRKNEMEWRGKLKALENERLMMEKRRRKRDEEWRMKQEAKDEKRDALIHELINKLGAIQCQICDSTIGNQELSEIKQ